MSRNPKINFLHPILLCRYKRKVKKFKAYIFLFNRGASLVNWVDFCICYEKSYISKEDKSPIRATLIFLFRIDPYPWKTPSDLCCSAQEVLPMVEGSTWRKTCPKIPRQYRTSCCKMKNVREEDDAVEYRATDQGPVDSTEEQVLFDFVCAIPPSESACRVSLQ